MKIISLILSLFVTIVCFGQDKIDNLVQIGVQYHDKGEYEKAIEVYVEALKIDPQSMLVHGELAMTYLYSGENEKAIEHCDIILAQHKDDLHAYITKGSALSNLGKTAQSIQLFEETITKFGGDYLLYYNLGVTYSKIQDFDNAETAFIHAITDNTNHASSHYSLAMIKAQQNQRAESVLSLYYFLLLEHSSWRAELAYNLLREQLAGNVQFDDDTMNIHVNLDSQRAYSELSTAAEIILATIEASNLYEETKYKTPEELFVTNSTSFFVALGEYGERYEQSGFWWDCYVSFFYHLAKSAYMDVFCHYISVSSNEKAIEWLEANDKKLSAFKQWVTTN